MARKYDSTVARVAGNIMSGFVNIDDESPLVWYESPSRSNAIVQLSVQLARAIVDEIIRTEPPVEVMT